MENKYLGELSDEKYAFIKKYDLKLSEDMCWYSDKNHSIRRVYFRHHFLLKNNMLEILFRKYQLCYAKLKYFRTNLSQYEYCKYTPFHGFIITELWDAEFFKHKNSGHYIDLRYLSTITEIELFDNLIRQLEEKQN